MTRNSCLENLLLMAGVSVALWVLVLLAIAWLAADVLHLTS